jgi:hypothetical protein
MNPDRRDQSEGVKAQRRFSGLTKRLAERDAVPPHSESAIAQHDRRPEGLRHWR